PTNLELSTWDEVVEVSIFAPAGELVVTSMMATDPEPLPSLIQAGPGSYRLRVHARDRDTFFDVVPEGDATEHFLIVAWPEDASPEAVLRQTDECGASLRHSAARQPSAQAEREDPLKQLIEEKLRRARE